MKGRFSLSYREIEELSKIRGLDIDHGTLQRWVVKFMPVLEIQFKKKRSRCQEAGGWMRPI
jgi:putative transposase